MRDFVLIYINGVRHEIRGRDARLSLSDYLRRRLGLVGTKIVCSEGDCGACSVLIGRADEHGLHYQVVDSCIQFLFQFDSTHVVTVEGLSPAGTLNGVQQAMIECHGSQCGFCTPGFVMAMMGLRENRAIDHQDDLRVGLTGNLCRCTGYVSILEAGLAAHGSEEERIGALYPPESLLNEFAAVEGEDICLTDELGREGTEVFAPATLTGALEYLQSSPRASVVAGATDVGVRVNKGMAWPEKILDLNRLRELSHVQVSPGALQLGARANWSVVEAVCRDLVPEFYKIVRIFGSPQIRNVGTVGGNLVNASPIADSLPFLHVMKAQLELASQRGTRTVSINDFYRGYKQFDLRPGELLTKVSVPLPSAEEMLRLYKVSRRRDLDIASFTAAVRMRLEDSRIADAAVAFGAVGPTVLRARRTEEFLIGQEFTEATMRAAGDIAVEEVTPISDVRGTAKYRLQLTRNVLSKFFFEHEPDAVIV